MGQIQKRYLYSALLSAAFFIIVYGFADFNIVLSVLLTIVIYLGGIFLFKEKDLRTLTPKYVDDYYFMASKCAARASQTADEEIKAYVDKITTYTDEILLSLTQRPKKVEQVFDFFDYYLDITNKILMRYNLLKNHENHDEKEHVFLDNTKNYLEKITDMFSRQLSNMKEARMLDIESEIRMFEHTIGLKKTDIEVGENDELK